MLACNRCSCQRYCDRSSPGAAAMMWQFLLLQLLCVVNVTLDGTRSGTKCHIKGAGAERMHPAAARTSCCNGAAAYACRCALCHLLWQAAASCYRHCLHHRQQEQQQAGSSSSYQSSTAVTPAAMLLAHGHSLQLLGVLVTHRTDVGHLLGAHIVGSHHERPLIGVQVVAQALVILQVQTQDVSEPNPMRVNSVAGHGRARTASFFSSLLAEGILTTAGPNRVDNRQAEFNLQ